MKSHIMDDMRDRFSAMKEHAEHFAANQVDRMVESGQAYELSDDEERMLKAYRRFVASHKPGEIFRG